MKRKVSLIIVLFLLLNSVSMKSFAKKDTLSVADKNYYKWEKPHFNKIDFIEIEKKQYSYKEYLIYLDVLKQMVKSDFVTLKKMYQELKEKNKELDKEEDDLEDKEDFYKDDKKIVKKQKKQLEKERKIIFNEKKHLAKNPDGLSLAQVEVASNRLEKKLRINEKTSENLIIKSRNIEVNLRKIEVKNYMLYLRGLELKERKLKLKKYEDDLEFLEDMIDMKKKTIEKKMVLK